MLRSHCEGGGFNGGRVGESYTHLLPGLRENWSDTGKDWIVWFGGEGWMESHQGPCAESYSRTTHRCHLSCLSAHLNMAMSLERCANPSMRTS